MLLTAWLISANSHMCHGSNFLEKLADCFICHHFYIVIQIWPLTTFLFFWILFKEWIPKRQVYFYESCQAVLYRGYKFVVNNCICYPKAQGVLDYTALLLSILIDIKWYFIFLIYISLITSETEIIFTFISSCISWEH